MSLQMALFHSFLWLSNISSHICTRFITECLLSGVLRVGVCKKERRSEGKENRKRGRERLKRRKEDRKGGRREERKEEMKESLIGQISFEACPQQESQVTAP